MIAAPLDVLATLAVPAHGGEEHVSVWRAWNFDLTLVVPIALVAFVYLRGLRRWPERSHPHSHWRTASYLSGLAVVLIALESPLDLMGERHFPFHMLQHELLLMVAAPLILLGAPTTPVLRGLPRALRLGVVRPLAGSPSVRGLFRLLTHPLFAVAFVTVVLWLWHLAPGWYDAALRDQYVHDLQHISFAVAGLLFWWNVIDPAPLRARMPYPLRMLYLLAGSTPKHFLAALITFAGAPLYEVYTQVEPVYNLSLKDDQAIGGLIMWVPSQMMHLVAIAIVFFVWAHRSEQDQRLRDAERLAVSRAQSEGAPSPT